MAAFLAIALIVWIMSDTVTQGRAGAVVKGTAKGAGRTTARAAASGARRAADSHRAYLASGRANGAVRGITHGARGARALAAGARDGAREELAKLKVEIARARAEMEAARAAAQDPAHGVTKGRGGHSFDQPPKGARARGARLEQTDTASQTAAASNSDPAAPVLPPTLPTPTPTPTPTGTIPQDPTEGNTPMSAMTMGSGGASLNVDSVPGFLAALAQLRALAQQVHEGGVAIGLAPGAQAGLEDAIDMLASVASTAKAQYQPLIEAADATHQGASAVTVGAARTE